MVVCGSRKSAKIAGESSCVTQACGWSVASGPFAAFVQQRIRHMYRRQRPA
jgi:hypothetical protein